MSHVYSVRKYLEYDPDDEWTEPIGYVEDFDQACRWAKDQIHFHMKKCLMHSKELGGEVKLIETQEQFNHFSELGISNSWQGKLGYDKAKFPIISPSKVGKYMYEFDITYYVGFEGKYSNGIEIHHWKFTALHQLPVVALS